MVNISIKFTEKYIPFFKLYLDQIILFAIEFYIDLDHSNFLIDKLYKDTKIFNIIFIIKKKGFRYQLVILKINLHLFLINTNMFLNDITILGGLNKFIFPVIIQFDKLIRMKKFFKEQITVSVEENKVLQHEVSTRKKERGNLEKQIDNLMAENNFLRCQSSTGKYQLQLIEKDRQIKMLKQKFQKELNHLNQKLANSTTMKSMYNSVNLVVKQDDKIDLDPGFRRLYNSNRFPNTNRQCDKCNLIKRENEVKQIEWSNEKQQILKSSIIIGKGEKQYDQRIIQYNKQIRNLKLKLQEKDAIIYSINQILSEVKQFNQQLKMDLSSYKAKAISENQNYQQLIQQLNQELNYKDQQLRILFQKFENNQNFGTSELIKEQNGTIQNMKNSMKFQNPQNRKQSFYLLEINQLRNQIKSLVQLNHLKSYNQQEYIVLKEKYNQLQQKNIELTREVENLNKIIKMQYQQKQKFNSLNTINYNLAKRIQNLETTNNGLNSQLSRRMTITRSDRALSSSTNHQQQYQDGVQTILDRLNGQNKKINKTNQQVNNNELNLKNKSATGERIFRTHQRNKSEQFIGDTPKKYMKPINYLLISPSMSDKTQPQQISIQSKINLLRNQTKQISNFLNKMF